MEKRVVFLCEMSGLHAIQAPGEAETLFAYLAIKGKVDAVLTEDTDVLAYGTPLMLAFKGFKLREEKLVGIHLPSLLEEMELNMEEFRDLCILLSCDYNSRVKGYPPDGRRRKKAIGIGAKGALHMIRKYRRLEEVCKHVEDPAPLKYRRCRELFTIPETIPDDFIPYNLRPDYERLEIFISNQNLTVKVPYIAKCYKPAVLNFDDSLDDSSSDESVSSEEETEDEGFQNPVNGIEKDLASDGESEVMCVVLGSDRQHIWGKIKNLEKSATRACIWTKDAIADDFWKTAPDVVICKCIRCYDTTKGEPIDFIFEYDTQQFKDLYNILCSWIDPNISISYSTHGEIVAHNFEQYIRSNYLDIFRIVGRDSFIFNTVLMEYIDPVVN